MLRAVSLQVDDDATTHEIKRAYRSLAKVCHPDFMGDQGHNICILLNGEATGQWLKGHNWQAEGICQNAHGARRSYCTPVCPAPSQRPTRFCRMSSSGRSTMQS